MPQLYPNCTQLKDNFMFSFLWRKLSPQDKQRFLSDPNNLKLRENQLKNFNSPEMQERLQPLYEGRGDAHLKLENLKTAQSLVATTFLVRYVQRTNPQLLSQAQDYAKNQLNTYMEQVFKPPLSTQEIYNVLEKYPYPGATREGLPRYDKATRAQRRATSRIVRAALTDYAMWETSKTAPYITSGQDFDRVHKIFFRPENTPQDQLHNQEVAILFNRNSNASRAADRSWVRKQLQSKPHYQEVNGVRQEQPWTEEALNQAVDAYFTPEAMRKRRGEILMESCRDAYQVYQNLGNLISPDLTPQQLAQNYFTIARASALYMELQTYSSDSNPEKGKDQIFEVSHQERQWLREQSEASINFSYALFSLNMMANPLYEYVDPEALTAYDMSKSESYYAGVFGELDGLSDDDQNDPIFADGSRTGIQNRATKKKDPYYEIHTELCKDSMDCLISDAIQARDALVNGRKYACEQMIETFGFTQGATRRYCEEYGHGKPSLYDFHQPVAYVLQDRVVILSNSLSPKDGFITRERPEELYNFNIDRTLSVVGDAYQAANRWYTGNVNGYETVGMRFGQVCQLGRLRSPQDLDQFTEAYTALLNASNYYLERKGDRLKPGLETQRVEAVKKMRDMASMKLNELDLIGKAVVTLHKYQNMTPEQIRTETARENAQPGNAQYINAEVAATRAKKPIEWLQNQYTRLYSGTLSTAPLDRSAPGIYLSGRLEAIANAEEPFAATEAGRDLIAGIAGSMAVREAIQQEKNRLNTPDQPSPLEKQLGGLKDNDLSAAMINRGREILKAATGKELDALTSQDLKNFLSTFDHREYVAQVNRDYQISPLSQKLTGQYLNAVTPVRGEKLDQYEQQLQQFARESILTPAQNLIDNPNAPANMEEARQLLSSCVLHSMIQMERAGGNHRQAGRMETMLSAPQGAAELRQRILISQPFEGMLTSLGNQPTNADVARLLEQNAPMNVAKLSIDLANRPQVGQNPPGIVPNAPQAGRQDPQRNQPQAGPNPLIPG